jgi:hypothetical protein
MATQQSFFQLTKNQWIEMARQTARELLGNGGTITIEEVLARTPRPAWIHRNSTGSVFQHHDFKAVGYTQAKKASSNRRVIRLWSLRQPVPQKWVPRMEIDNGR